MTQAANPAAANFDRTKAKSAVESIQKAMNGLSTGFGEQWNQKPT
ncbi:hypothetical protein [Pseudomonas brenneri]